jgi:error-prone DNA polymerase
VQADAVRFGLNYVKGLAEAEARAIVAERDRGGRFRSLGDLAARVALRRGTLEQLAWSGACDSLIDDGDRRGALWQLGIATPAEGSPEEERTQLALPFALPPAPALRPLGRWQRLIADYSTSGVTIGDHAMAILRPRLTVPLLATSAQLLRLPAGGEVAVAGLVIARQKPGTAGGTMFLLFEDEFGTVNLIVSKAVYERHRLLARTEPLLLARGRLERYQEGQPVTQLRSPSAAPGSPATAGDGRQDHDREEIRPVINVIVRELAPLERFLPGGLDEADARRVAEVRKLPERRGVPASEESGHAEGEELVEGTEIGSSIRAVAPPVQSFAAGRRR